MDEDTPFEVKANPKYLKQQTDLINRYQLKIPSEFPETYTRFVGVFIPFIRKSIHKNSLVLFYALIDKKHHPTTSYWTCAWPHSSEELCEWIDKEIDDNLEQYENYIPYLSFNSNYLSEIDSYFAMKLNELELIQQSEIEKRMEDLIDNGTLKLLKQQKTTNVTQKQITAKTH